MTSPANKRKKNFCVEFAGNNEGNLRVFKHLFKLWCKYTGDEEKEQDNQPAPSKAHWGCKTKSVLCVDLRRVELAVHHRVYCTSRKSTKSTCYLYSKISGNGSICHIVNFDWVGVNTKFTKWQHCKFYIYTQNSFYTSVLEEVNSKTPALWK